MNLSEKKVVVLAVCLIVGFAVVAVLYTNGAFKKAHEEKYKPYTYKGIAFTLPEKWVKDESVDYFLYGSKGRNEKDKDNWVENIEIFKHTYDLDKYLPADKQIDGVLKYYKGIKKISNFKKTKIKVDGKNRIAFTATTNDKLNDDGKEKKNADDFSDNVSRTVLLIPHKADLYTIMISYSDIVDEDEGKEHKNKILQSMSFSWE